MSLLAGFSSWHGITVARIGRNLGYVALGHHGPASTLEAFNSYAREVLGLVDVSAGGLPADQWPPVEACWVVLRERCDLFGFAGHDPGCRRCQEIGEFGLDWSVGPDTPDAFPVMLMLF